MHKLEYILENDTHKILWDFEIQTDHLISTRRPESVIVYKRKRTYWQVNFARELKKLWNIKVTVILITIGVLTMASKGLVKGLEELEINRYA